MNIIVTSNFPSTNQPLKLILSLLILSMLSCEQVDKSPSQTFTELWVDATTTYLPTTAEWTNRVEVADINGDGRIDLLFANGGNYSSPGNPEPARVFLNQGPENPFQEVTTTLFGEETFLSRVIKVRDINQDAIPDIIVGTTYQTQSQLYLGQGNGAFSKVTDAQLPQMNLSIGDLELGDVDRDGDLDMVLADWGPGDNMNNAGGITRLWLNDGKGYFTDVTATQMPDLPIQFSWDLEFFDFDNDFDLDIAISCKRCASSRIFVNDGKGYFTEKRLLPAYTNNYELEPMDINSDGFLDLVTVNDGEIVDGISYSRREHLFLNDSGRRFIDATHLRWSDIANIGEDDNNVVFLDYDSDGDPDFLLSSLTGEDRLLVNNGTGQFELMQPVLSGTPTPLTLSMVLGDINNDQRMDIIMGQGEGSEGIEERIFIGKDIEKDTAPPIISNWKITEGGKGQSIVMARIHDHKSPNMPQDWKSILLNNENGDTIQMEWYGENLWTAAVSATKGLTLCATDYCGNTTCKTLE